MKKILTILVLLAASPALAAPKISLLCVPAGNMVAAFVALDKGYFAAKGVDVTFAAANNGSMIPAAIVGQSADIGGPSPTVLLQADDAGLDLVVVASTLKEPQKRGENGTLARTGSGIKGPADLKGRKVGVPGFGGIFDIVAKKWVALAGVDYHDVKWVELLFPQQADAMKAGLVDAVTSINPFYDRIIASGAGYAFGDIEDILPPGTAPIVLVAKRSWAESNKPALAAFRAGLAEAAAYVNDPDHTEEIRATIARWTKLPPQVVSVPVNVDPTPKPENLQFWIDVAHEQGIIKAKPDARSLIEP